MIDSLMIIFLCIGILCLLYYNSNKKEKCRIEPHTEYREYVEAT